MIILLSSFAAGKRNPRARNTAPDTTPANDNVICSRGASQHPEHGCFGVPHDNRQIAWPQTFRIAMRVLLLASFSAVVLVAVSGAFLVGLVLVGLLAAGVAGFDLIRRRMPRPAIPSLWPLDRRVAG
jgi:hypothetical protein